DVLEQVWRAMAYAHHRGVIHRDLKPSNVMVGVFGEVLVMDWGLAKVLQRAPDAEPPAPSEDTSAVTARAPSPLAQTRDGEVLGTVAYMAPEQARCQLDQMNEACDVFGLGGILCKILSEWPPYMGRDYTAVLGRAQRAELGEAFDRLSGCGFPAELTQIARHCLDPLRELRPSAEQVVSRLTAYRAGEEAREQKMREESLAAELRAEAEARAREGAESRLAAETRALAEAEADLEAETRARMAAEARAKEWEESAKAAEPRARTAAAKAGEFRARDTATTTAKPPLSNRQRRLTWALAASLLLGVIAGGA